MQPRKFLLGLVVIPRWEYEWGLTIPQIELMLADQPIVVYPKNKGKDKAPDIENFKAVEEKWKTRKTGQKIKLSDLLQ